MTFIDLATKNSKKEYLQINQKEVKFLVHGQGVLLFKCSYTDICSLKILNKEKDDGIVVHFNPLNVYGMTIKNKKLLIDRNNNKGLIDRKGAYYWICLDSQNQRLTAGIGEARIENVIYKYEWQFTKEQEIGRVKNKKFLESLILIELTDVIEPLIVLRDPITRNVPMLVARTDDLSIDDVAEGKYLPDSNLTLIGQKLFNCISGSKFVLDDESFPDFSKAIEQSIRTPGLWCYEKLKEKANEFNKDKPNIYETYLRITLGENNGESPGIPYVIEIWPVGHYSPIHNHSGANAIIRVLNGSINVSLFSFLCQDEEGIEPFAKVDFNKEDITWINASLNQVHQLKNLETNKEACITIQCYMYDLEDSLHYDYFDYLDVYGNKKQYEPDSDMDFIEFKQLMKKEWSEVNANKVISSPNKVNLEYKNMKLVDLKKLCQERNISLKGKTSRFQIIDLLNAYSKLEKTI